MESCWDNKFESVRCLCQLTIEIINNEALFFFSLENPGEKIPWASPWAVMLLGGE